MEKQGETKKRKKINFRQIAWHNRLASCGKNVTKSLDPPLFVTFEQCESVTKVLSDIHRVDGRLLDVRKAVSPSTYLEKSKQINYTQGHTSEVNVVCVQVH